MKNCFDVPCDIEFTDGYLITKDKTGESKINLSGVEEIHEIQEYYFIKLAVNMLILPKAKLDKTFINQVEAIAQSMNIPVQRKLDWVWK